MHIATKSSNITYQNKLWKEKKEQLKLKLENLNLGW